MSKPTFEFEFDPEELKRVSRSDSTAPVEEPKPSKLDDEDRGGRAASRRISVHALGQMAFCPRSAVLALERGDQEDPEEQLPRLDYLPNFDLARIEESLKVQVRWLLVAVTFLVMLLVPLVFGMWWGEPLVIYPSLGIVVGLLWWIANLAEDVLILSQRRHAALNATAKEPSPRIDAVQEISWWEMIRAGFEPAKYERPFQHPLLPLEGSPWRVLQRDSLRIPVVRSNAQRLGNRKGEVFEKHCMRLAAYAVLLETTDHVQSPYGLVFLNDDHRGLAVPITQHDKDSVHEAAERFRLLLKQMDAGEAEPARPENESHCRTCPYGQPVHLNDSEESQLNADGQDVFVILDHSDRRFHSNCGNRFRWIPPHAKAMHRQFRVGD
ncbi:PD-(D/E)XK nuclease family protein [bacterium]|nr:PD-(D/E)XK nuclease family protein [bacterium]